MIEVFITYDPMEANVIKAKFDDEGIPFKVIGDYDIAYSMETFNTPLSRMALKRPIKFFVPEEYYEIAKVSVNTDNTNLLDDNLEY